MLYSGIKVKGSTVFFMRFFQEMAEIKHPEQPV